MNLVAKVCLALLALLVCMPPSTAAAELDLVHFTLTGSPNTSFGGDGEVVATISDGHDIKFDAAGKMVVGLGGFFGGFQVARFNANGTLDQTFGQGGISPPASPSGSSEVHAVALHQGKIIAAGVSPSVDGGWRIWVARFNGDGTLDTSFNGTGSAAIAPAGYHYAYATSVAVMPTSGRIIVGGRVENQQGTDRRFFAARLTAAGALDPSFSGDGMTTIQFPGTQYCNGYDLVLQSNSNEDAGFVALAGDVGTGSAQTMGVAMLGLNGALLTSFSSDGLATIDFGSGAETAKALKLDTQGRLVVAGNVGTQFAVARVLSSGALDVSFSADGRRVISFSDLVGAYATDVLVDANNKVFVIGYGWSQTSYKVAIGALTASGTLNKNYDSDGRTTFDPPAHVYVEALGAAFDASGLIMLTGLVAN